MSPLIDGGRVIVHVGDDKKGRVVAFDAATGKEIWSLAGDGPGYASPVVATYGGVKQYVTMTAKSVISVSGDGKLLWSVPFPDEWNENIVTPVPHGQRLIVAGVRKGSLAYDIVKDGTTWSPKLAWHKTDLPMYMSSPVLDGDVLYGMSSRRKGQLVAVDAKTGDVKWATEGRAGQNSAVVVAGPHVLFLTTDGDLIVAAKDPAKYQEVRRYKVADHPSWTYPVLLGDRVVIKDDEKLTLWKIS
jgi:outer membrane protein assembly factor BamB